MKSVLDKNFRYRPSHDTDIKKTFDRVRREQKANAEEVKIKVKTIPARKA